MVLSHILPWPYPWCPWAGALWEQDYLLGSATEKEQGCLMRVEEEMFWKGPSFLSL